MNDKAVKWTARVILWELLASFINLSLGVALINAECRDTVCYDGATTALFGWSRLFWVNVWMVILVFAAFVIFALAILAIDGTDAFKEEEDD